MKNSTHKRLKWALLLLVPVILFALITPVARKQRRAAATQEFLRAVENVADSDRLELLLARGADVNARLGEGAMTKGDTALHYLAPHGDSEDQMRVLLSHGADINAQNQMGYTPLMVAAMMSSSDNIRLLIANHARTDLKSDPHYDYRARSGKGLTALDIARDSAKSPLMTGMEVEMKRQRKDTLKILKAASAEE